MAVLFVEGFDVVPFKFTSAEIKLLPNYSGLLETPQVIKASVPPPIVLMETRYRYASIEGYVMLVKGVKGASVAEKTTNEVIGKQTVTDGHQIYMEGSRTINLGNYESAKVTVGVTVPTTKTGLNDAYEFASEWVSLKIEDATKDLKSV